MRQSGRAPDAHEKSARSRNRPHPACVWKHVRFRPPASRFGAAWNKSHSQLPRTQKFLHGGFACPAPSATTPFPAPFQSSCPPAILNSSSPILFAKTTAVSSTVSCRSSAANPSRSISPRSGALTPTASPLLFLSTVPPFKPATGLPSPARLRAWRKLFALVGLDRILLSHNVAIHSQSKP